MSKRDSRAKEYNVDDLKIVDGVVTADGVVALAEVFVQFQGKTAMPVLEFKVGLGQTSRQFDCGHAGLRSGLQWVVNVYNGTSW